MGLKSKDRRRALSTVISALILSAVTLAVGGSIWAFSQGAMTITAEDYAESVINMTDIISERFIIEHVGYVSEISDDLYVWVFNYGDVDIEFKLEVEGYTGSMDWTGLASKDMKRIILLDSSPSSEDELNIKAYSRRGNHAYYLFIVPS